MIGYNKCFDSNKTMSFKVSDKKLLKKYKKIWKKMEKKLWRQNKYKFSR